MGRPKGVSHVLSDGVIHCHMMRIYRFVVATLKDRANDGGLPFRAHIT